MKQYIDNDFVIDKDNSDYFDDDDYVDIKRGEKILCSDNLEYEVVEVVLQRKSRP